MTTGDQLLRAIAEKPDEDAVRLVYADWLEESGDADRAAFVRAQVQVAREPALRLDSPAKKQAERLWRANGSAWVKELPVWLRTLPRWRRGTLHSAHLSARNFLKHGDALFRRFPTVHTLGFSNEVGLWPDVVAHRAFARVRGVEAIGRTDEQDVAALLGSPHTTGLRSLTIRTAPDLHQWEALLRPGVLPGLTQLVLNYIPPGPYVAALLAAGGLAGLTRLSFEQAGVGVTGARHLTGASFWGRLHDMELSSNQLGDDGVQALADRPPTAVRCLALRENEISPLGIAALAGTDLPDLIELNLSQNPLGPTGLRPLFWSHRLERLYVHGMMGGPPDPSVFKSAAARLTDLGMANAGITDDVVKSLAGSPRLTNLVYLDLSYNPWGNKGAAALAASPNLTALVTLDVQGTGVTERGLTALRKRWGEGVIA